MVRARFAVCLLLVALAGAARLGLVGQDGRPAPRLLGAVPHVAQSTDYSCGPCALVAVLAYYGIAAREGDVVRQARTNPEVGAELEDLAGVARRYGVEAIVRQGLELADLERELDAGYPVIVLNQSWREDSRVPWERDWDDGHYLVVIGMDADLVYVEDPNLEEGRGFIPRREFVERWHGWTIDQRRTTGQALLVHGKPSPKAPGMMARFERVP